jgi:hypothetical protein
MTISPTILSHTTEVVKNTLDPVWRPFSIKTSKLAASLDSNFRINVIDWDSIGSHDPIGHIIMTPKVCTARLPSLYFCNNQFR